MKIKVTKCFRSELSDEIYDDPIGFTDYTEKIFDDLKPALDYFNQEMELWMDYLKWTHDNKTLDSVCLKERKGRDEPFNKHHYSYDIPNDDIYTYYMPEMTIIED